MSDEEQEAMERAWEEAHPWLSQLTCAGKESSIDEMTRYAMDELRLA